MRPPFPVSTREWIPSDIIAEDPVIAAAINLMQAMIRFPAIAATTAMVELPWVVTGYSLHPPEGEREGKSRVVRPPG